MTIPDIHYVNGKYYNRNGKNPNKVLTVPYGKRLLSIQKRYSGLVDTKTASGHGKLTEKKPLYDEIIKKKNIKKSVRNLNQIDFEGLLKDIANKKIDTKNLRTRFRAGFRVYKDEYTEDYASVTYHNAQNGIISLQHYINKLDESDYDVFGENVRGSFRYVIYDKVTMEVHHDFKYGEDDE